MISSTALLSSLTIPMNIATNPASMLWMFPLLLGVSVIYKAVKMRVLFPAKFIKEVAVLFVSISIFICIIGALLHVIVHFMTT